MSEDTAPDQATTTGLSLSDTEHFKGRLKKQQTAVQEGITRLEQSLAEPDQYGEQMQERGDDATLLRAHDDIWDQLAFLRTELVQVDKALARIDAGTYGKSEVSGRAIPRERLEALPSATTLVDEIPPK